MKFKQYSQTFIGVIFIIILFSCSGKKKKKFESSFLFPYEEVDYRIFSSTTSKGYMDVKGNIITEAKFVQAYPFTEGLGCVAEASNYGFQYGYIDSTGNYVISPMYADARPFHEGRALVSIDGRHYGFIDRMGNPVSPSGLDIRTSDYHQGTCYTYEFVRMVSGSAFEEIIVAIFTLGTRNANEPMYKVCQMDKNGKMELLDSTAFGFTHASLNNWHRQNHLIQFQDSKKNYGFKRVNIEEFVNTKNRNRNSDTLGTVAIQPTYSKVEDFVYGYAKVHFLDGNRGYIDTTGKVMVKYERKIKKKKRRFRF